MSGLSPKRPWIVGEYDETGGYDCMTGRICVGPVHLDGADYGQAYCDADNATAPPQMLADALLIGAAHDLLAALVDAKDALVSAKAFIFAKHGSSNPAREAAIQAAAAAIAKATAL